ncbi:hypothetical protein [Microbacterium aurantiacum]|uniref:hypothetical protein n=1 Tax=Microbacterium aurantiacum TaxID=162393 RepID=UPI000C804BEA|nr:hypothetical protein [Microbacterium aurantiacum]
MSNPDALANSQEPMFQNATDDVDESEDLSDLTFPTDTGQPETQGEEPLEAELDEDGQGDLAFNDGPDAVSGDAPEDLRESLE